MKGIIIFLILISFFCQCGRQPAIVYEGMISPRSERLTTAVLNDSFLFNWPKDIMVADSLLLVHDSYKQTKCFHIFCKKSGRFVKSFGHKGRGPGEFRDINSVNDNYDGTITAYDLSHKKAVVFDINGVLQDRKPCFKEYSVSQAPNFIKQMLRFKNEFIVKGNDDKLRYGIWNPFDGTFRAVYSKYPGLSEEAEDNWSLTDYGVKVRLSPDGRKLAAATYIGGILELFDIDENGFDLRTSRFFFEPRYDYAQGAVPRWVATTPETIIGFEDLFLADNAVYGLVWGIERSEMNNHKPRLFCFDLDGNPIKSYITDEMLESVVVDNDGTIYGVGSDSMGHYKLCRYFPTDN